MIKIRLQSMGTECLAAIERGFWMLACVLFGMYAAVRADAAINGGSDGSPRASGSSLVTLEIPSLQLRTTVYSDTSEVHLNRGAGLIRGMASPNGIGNVGIAGHRDSIFRPLEGIEVGTEIKVHTASYRYLYEVTSITIVDRTDVALLRRTEQPVITLVTCFPFRFVGPAPKRFVVRGQLRSAHATNARI